MHNNGFIIVASLNKKFLTSAVYCANSLKDHWPEAQVTLFTESEWIEPHLYESFNSIIGGAPNSKRAKLWALDKSPYDITVYLDADMEIMSSEINTIFDYMTDTSDILMTRIRPYNGKISKFPGGELVDHCGFFMYNSKKHTQRFMTEWWNLYQKQESREWKWDTALYPEELRNWDQWTFWWLQNKTEYVISREYFPDDARWNFVNGYKYSETNKDIIIYHHTIS